MSRSARARSSTGERVAAGPVREWSRNNAKRLWEEAGHVTSAVCARRRRAAWSARDALVLAAGRAAAGNADPLDLQHPRPRARRGAVLLLVPDALDPGQRARDGDRLPGHQGEATVMIFAAVNGVELGVVIALFTLVTVLGFVASRWRRAQTLDNLDEWGLGGRNFGSSITWFLVGGDLYTAYTFVAVPALLFGVGALGFFAVPYTIVVYPMVFLVAPRLWSVSHRYGSGSLALMVAITGIAATMPYIALQLVGIEAVLKAMGILGEWPIIIAFGVLAAYTYQSGLRAPALIAFVKDSLIYLVVIVAIIYIPTQLGGFDDIFAAADKKFSGTDAPTDGVLLGNAAVLGYSTLAFGSALALFLYPHSVTGVLAARSRDTIKRNMAALPAYSIMLGLLALLGYMA